MFADRGARATTVPVATRSQSAACLLLVLISGNPAVQHLLGKELFLIAPPVLLGLWALMRGVRLRREDGSVVALFAVVIGVHLAMFGSSVIPASVGFLLKLVTGLLVVRLVPTFASTYVALMYRLALLSLVFYLPHVAGLDLRSALSAFHVPYTDDEHVVHIGLHNFGPAVHALRNCGMFWEPGAFAGYLVLSFLFMLSPAVRARTGRRTVVVIALTLMTTLSTTGYLAAAGCFLVLWAMSSSTRKTVIITVVASAAIVAFQSLPFLGEKIESQLQASNEQANLHEINRVGNALYDLAFIEARPAFGWSVDPGTRVAFDANVEEFVARQGNGFTGFAVRFGLIGLAGCLYSFYRAFGRLYGIRLAAFLAMMVLATLLVGEQFLNFPLFLSLFFLQPPPFRRPGDAP